MRNLYGLQARLYGIVVLALVGLFVLGAVNTYKVNESLISRRQAELMKADDWLPLYRAVNQPASLAVTAELNVSAALRATSPRHYPQIWVNGWQLRNLRMVGNVLQVVRDRPGGRVLSIVGMSHKPWFDDWLGQMQGVDIVDAEQVLR